MDYPFLKNLEEIQAWLAIHQASNHFYSLEEEHLNLGKGRIPTDFEYEIIPDEKYGFVVNVRGNVLLSKYKFKHIPVKFNIINGDFYCHNNNLTSLEFAPINVYGHFNCSNNNLTSLESCPVSVDGYFDCSYNHLKSLQFCPKTVGTSFLCHCNDLISLEYGPKHVNGDFDCGDNSSTSMCYFPSSIDDDFNCSYNKIKSLQYCPDLIRGVLDYSDKL